MKSLDQEQGDIADEAGEEGEEEHHSPDGLVDPDGCVSPLDEPEQWRCIGGDPAISTTRDDLRRVRAIPLTEWMRSIPSLRNASPGSWRKTRCGPHNLMDQATDLLR